MAIEERLNRQARFADLLILASGLLSVLGWTLALMGRLTPLIYLCGSAVALGAAGWIHRGAWRFPYRKIKRRIRRPIVALYAIIWLAALIGGSLYAPSNYDALSYRIPQFLHWVAEGRWHWIDAANSRMNIAPPGMNWLIAPLYFLTKSDRLWFLVNLTAFTFLPGYLFELFRRAGASPRIAWWFMWLIPCGYSFALQAGSIGNDLLGTAFATAGIAIGLRARTSGKAADVLLSGIAIAMATGIKSVNLPLLIPWAVAVWPTIHRVLARPALTTVAIIIAGFASCLPTTILNLRETGHWTGDPKDEHRVRQPNAGAGLTSNAVMLLLANTQPPVLPNPSFWNERFEHWLRKTPLEDLCRAAPRFEMRWGELPTEELAAAGPGILLISGIMLIWAIRRRRLSYFPRRDRAWGIAFAGWFAFLVFLSRFSSEAVGRLTTGFVPVLVLPVLLLAGTPHLFRHWGIRVLTAACASLSLPGLVLSPARPLLPVQPLLALAGSSRLNRVATVYRTYSRRADCYAPLLQEFDSASLPELWFAGGGDDPEAPAWKPYGSRKVRQWLQSTPVEDLGTGTALVSELGIQQRFQMTWEEFKRAKGLEVLDQADLDIRAGRGAERWYLVRPTPPQR